MILQRSNNKQTIIVTEQFKDNWTQKKNNKNRILKEISPSTTFTHTHTQRHWWTGTKINNHKKCEIKKEQSKLTWFTQQNTASTQTHTHIHGGCGNIAWNESRIS